MLSSLSANLVKCSVSAFSADFSSSRRESRSSTSSSMLPRDLYTGLDGSCSESDSIVMPYSEHCDEIDCICPLRDCSSLARA